MVGEDGKMVEAFQEGTRHFFDMILQVLGVDNEKEWGCKHDLTMKD